nr:FAD-binding domain-containing protein [Thauera phenylacetica]
GSALLELHGAPCEVLPALARAVGTDVVVCEAIAAPEEEDELAALRAAGLRVRTVWQSSLLDPAALPFAPARLPKVFTAFRQAVESAGLQPPAPLPAAQTLPPWPDLATGAEAAHHIRACRPSYKDETPALPCRSGGSRESGGATSDADAEAEHRIRACRRSYKDETSALPCRSGGSRESGDATSDADAEAERSIRACRRSYKDETSALPCRSGGSRESGDATSDADAEAERSIRACRRSYKDEAPALPCRSGGRRESGDATSDADAEAERSIRACRRSYKDEAPALPCRSGGSRESGGATIDADAEAEHHLRACRHSCKDEVSVFPYRAEPASFPWWRPDFAGGEGAALAHLAGYFASERPRHYKATRNGLSGVDFSSKFSPWLAQGALSPRRVFAALRRHEAAQGVSEGSYWLWFELLWRDYFRFLHLQHGRRLYRARGLNAAAPPPAHDPAAFAAWCEGRTGHAFIDAGMRELAATGWLSNRMRQIVASYLIHDLGCDWRAGAAWFEAQLVDYDVYSNQGNWLYIAGRGTDPRGGRRFDPDRQAATHDADGAYRTRWAELDRRGAD